MTRAVAATPRTKKDAQSQATRERLVAAATTLFAEQGFRSTTVQAIGERAGISRGSIFWHFGSKEGLLWAVVERSFSRWETETLVPDVGDAIGIEAMRRGLASHRRFLTEDPGALRLFYVLMFEALGPRPELLGEFVSLHEHLRDVCASWITAGQRAGEIRPDLDARATVTVLIATMGGIAYQALVDPDGLELDRVYTDASALFERGLRPTAPTTVEA